MEYTTIRFEEKESIGILTLNRPKVINAMNQTMIEELEHLLNILELSEETRVLILTGAGEKGFCSGMDMKESVSQLFAATPETIYKAQSRASRLFLKLRQIPQPVISAVHGAAAGVGFSLTLASDVRVITPEARFNAAYINIGLGGADLGSSFFLPRMIGSGRANEYLLTGDFISAEDAVALGFVSRVVPRDRLLETALELAGKMTGKSRLGLKMTKEAINQNLGVTSLEQALHLENRNQSFMIAGLKISQT
ncbi:enoyl-CoA hydratase/isomerase family protein [bacterium]|nr:enoyl-CoA hydratase/isomerase family protein [bacterium]